MSRTFSPDLQQVIDERMAAGGYASEDELLLDAMLALEQLEKSHQLLRAEIQSRLDRSGKPPAEPLDIDAFKAEMRATFRTNG